MFSNRYCCETKYTPSMYAVLQAEISTHPTNKVNVSQGNSTSFSVTAMGEELTYQWQKNGMNLENNNASKFEGVVTMKLTVNDVQVQDAGRYKCVVTNGAGDNVTSREATLSVGEEFI